MLHVETFSSNNEDDLTNQINYFLKQIDENMIKDIKFSSFAFFSENKENIIFSAMIIDYVR